MPKGPSGQVRPADSIGCAVMVAKIAVGEVEDATIVRRGRAGGIKRSQVLSVDERTNIAKQAASARWTKKHV